MRHICVTLSFDDDIIGAEECVNDGDLMEKAKDLLDNEENFLIRQEALFDAIRLTVKQNPDAYQVTVKFDGVEYPVGRDGRTTLYGDGRFISIHDQIISALLLGR